jgi:hypothetical protein
VIFNLDPGFQSADDYQGGGGASRNGGRIANSFVVSILTCKPLALKILQSIFAEPAPVKTFEGWGGGGYPENPLDFHKMEFSQRE